MIWAFLAVLIMMPVVAFVVMKYASYGWHKGKNLAEKGGATSDSTHLNHRNDRTFED